MSGQDGDDPGTGGGKGGKGRGRGRDLIERPEDFVTFGRPRPYLVVPDPAAPATADAPGPDTIVTKKVTATLEAGTVTYYVTVMIKSFRSKALEAFFRTGKTGKLPVRNTARLERILATLSKAKHPGDMNLPGWKYHPLHGPMAGRYAVWVSGNYRVSFAWDGENATDVDLEDYH